MSKQQISNETNKMFKDLGIKEQAKIVLDDYSVHIALYTGVEAPFGKMSESEARKKYNDLDWKSIDNILARCANATLHAFNFMGLPVPKKNCPIIFNTVEMLVKIVETGKLPKQ